MTSQESIIFTIFLVFAGASALATAALFARQAMIVAYIVLGILVGPGVFNLIAEPTVVEGIAEIGIMFLLYLLGLNLYPQKLLQMLAQATWLTLGSSLIFAITAWAIAWGAGFATIETVVIAVAMMFSSTILGLKLLPTTALHHRHAGEIIISVLLIQDLVAILVLLVIQGYSTGSGTAIWTALLALPFVVALSFAAERWLLMRLLNRFDQIQEYVFLLTIGWCLAIAQLSHWLGLSYEIGAFIAGVALASSPVARFIAESMKPLRDFFLVIFFFSLGASLEPSTIPHVLLPAAILAAVLLTLKPLVFSRLLRMQGETPKLAREMGVRLGQISEFSLLIAVVAANSDMISATASSLIKVTVILGFVVSSYWIVMRYPTPIAVDPALRRD